MAENRILFLAPASIPVNGAESIVNLKLIKLLISKGYEIDLISKKYKWDHYPVSRYDDLLSSLSSATVLEVDNHFGVKALWYHLRAWLRFGVLFKGIHWAYLASKKVESLIAEKDYKCVITKNIPSEVVGYWIMRRYRIPWIATWNDPYPHERYPEPYGKGPSTRLALFKKPLISQMSSADAHIFPSGRLRDYMLSYLNCDINKTFVISHIVESVAGCPKQRDGILNICYIGNLDGPRKPWTLLEAISIVKNRCIDNAMRVDFVGTTPVNMCDVIKEKGIDDIVNILPPVSYNESLKLMSRYDVALIIEAPCKEGVFLPAMVSDAMAAGISIFAVSPGDGVLHDMYTNGYIQFFSDVTKVDSIVNEMMRLIDLFNSNQLKKPLIPEEYKSDFIGCQYDNIIEML